MDPLAFAAACRNLGTPAHHAEAELALISLRSSPHAVETALEILRTNADDLVTFHAAMLLRDAALRQYHATGLSAATVLMQQTLEGALARSVRGSGDALLQTAAAIYKRCFLDNSDEGRRQLIVRITELMLDERTEWHATRLLLQIIWEFSLTSQSTYLGQSLEFHTKCGRLFTRCFLKDVFIFVASHLGSLRSPEALVCGLDVLEAILSWPFEQYSMPSEGSSTALSALYSIPSDHRAGTLHLRNTSRRISPKGDWSFLVKSDDICRTLLGLYFQSRAGNGSSPQQKLQDEEKRARIRQIFISLSCLSGDVFETEESRIAHAKRLAQIGYTLCENAFRDRAAFNKEVNLAEHETTIGSECLSGCVIVARSLTITSPHLLLKDDSMLPNLMGLTVAISDSCRLCAVRYESTFLGESLQALTSVWVLFVSHVMSPSIGSAGSGDDRAEQEDFTPPQVAVATKTSAYQVFESLVQTKWQAAYLTKDTNEEEEDEEADEEEMGDLASIARGLPRSSLAYLINLLRTFDSASHDSPETRAERLGFLFKLLSDVLADPDEGEVPIIPRAILEYSRSCAAEGTEDLVITAGLLLLELLQKETSRLNLVSPLLSGTMLSAVRRWCASYLFPPASLYAKKSSFRGGFRQNPNGGDAESSAYTSSMTLPPSIQQSFSDPVKGLDILNFLIRTSCIHLGAFGSEESVGMAAVQLLEVCTKNKQILKESVGWQEIRQANIASVQSETWDPLASLAATVHGSLVRILAASFQDPNDFDAACFFPLNARLTHLVKMQQQNVSITPKWINDATRVCELFRGCAKSTYMGGELSRRIRERTISALDELVLMCELAQTSAGNEAILLGVLSVFADFCESQLSFTESQYIPIVFTASKRLVDVFSKVQAAEKARRKPEVPYSSEELEFRAHTLNKVLRLLIALSERNSLDFSSSSDSDVVASGQEQDASGVVLACIDSVLPLFDRDLFQVVDVVESYFDLVAGMCRTRPEHVSSLSHPLFQAVVTSLQFGCEHHDSKIQRWCFESISALAKMHADTNGRSLAFQLQVNPTLLFDFIAKILELVVLSADMNSLDAAAGALLNLARCDQYAFGRAVEATLHKASSHRREGALIDPNAETARVQALVQALRTQFEKLFEGVKIQGADRMDRKRFGGNLASFVREVRAFVLIK